MPDEHGRPLPRPLPAIPAPRPVSDPTSVAELELAGLDVDEAEVRFIEPAPAPPLARYVIAGRILFLLGLAALLAGGATLLVGPLAYSTAAQIAAGVGVLLTLGTAGTLADPRRQ